MTIRRSIAIPSPNGHNHRQPMGGTQQRGDSRFRSMGTKNFPQGKVLSVMASGWRQRISAVNSKKIFLSTRKGIKGFGVHDMGDPRKGKRHADRHRHEVENMCSPEDIARRERTVEFEKATKWLGKQLGFTITDKPHEPSRWFVQLT